MKNTELQKNNDQINKTIDDNTQNYAKAIKNDINDIKKDVKVLKIFSIITALSTTLIAIIWILYFFIIQY